MTGPPPFRTGTGLRRVHHVGVTVADLDRAVAFWERLLGAPARARTVLDGPQVGKLVGYPGARIERCWIDLPGGVELELVSYLGRHEEPYDPGTAHPGNVHLCLEVDDMDGAHHHAVGCGASPVSSSPIEIRAGPNAGGKVAYLRGPDGVTLELLQRPHEG